MSHLLVVEDESRICRFLSRALEAHGHTVETARTGEDALRLTADHEFALVVLDLLLPGMDGYDVLEALLAADARTRVLVLSALGDVETRVQCLRAGAVDFLAKPFAVSELIARVDARITEHPSRVQTRWLTVGPARLDLQHRELWHGDRGIELSQREFVLICHLMRRAGEVCTRDELLADVWGYSFDPGSNVLDVCVGRLRAKLAHPHIRTVRNVGYSFVA